MYRSEVVSTATGASGGARAQWCRRPGVALRGGAEVESDDTERLLVLGERFGEQLVDAVTAGELGCRCAGGPPGGVGLGGHDRVHGLLQVAFDVPGGRALPGHGGFPPDWLAMRRAGRR